MHVLVSALLDLGTREWMELSKTGPQAMGYGADGASWNPVMADPSSESVDMADYSTYLRSTWVQYNPWLECGTE